MGIWSAAGELAAKTPPERNRYVDFLRAVSILVVVIGHWLIATVYYVDGELTPGHLLRSEPQFHWLTWLFQVMPIFFIVGGYSNAVSLESARRKGLGYAGWLVARLNRLVTPLLLLFVVWAVIAVVMHFLGARPGVIQFTSRASMIPTWFLAIYIMVVIFAPLTYKLWRRLGFASFWILAALAVATEGLEPPDDALASAWYRRQVAPVHLRRLLLDEEQIGRLDTFWNELSFISRNALTIHEGFDVFLEFQSQSGRSPPPPRRNGTWLARTILHRFAQSAREMGDTKRLSLVFFLGAATTVVASSQRAETISANSHRRACPVIWLGP